MAQSITANDLKTKGISILNEETSSGDEVLITVRGKKDTPLINKKPVKT